MLPFLRTLLSYLLLTCVVAGLLGGMLSLSGLFLAGGPLIAIGISGALVVLSVDFGLSLLQRRQAVARGFEVKLVSPVKEMKHE